MHTLVRVLLTGCELFVFIPCSSFCACCFFFVCSRGLFNRLFRHENLMICFSQARADSVCSACSVYQIAPSFARLLFCSYLAQPRVRPVVSFCDFVMLRVFFFLFSFLFIASSFFATDLSRIVPFSFGFRFFAFIFPLVWYSLYFRLFVFFLSLSSLVASALFLVVLFPLPRAFFFLRSSTLFAFFLRLVVALFISHILLAMRSPRRVRKKYACFHLQPGSQCEPVNHCAAMPATQGSEATCYRHLREIHFGDYLLLTHVLFTRAFSFIVSVSVPLLNPFPLFFLARIRCSVPPSFLFLSLSSSHLFFSSRVFN